MQEVRGGGVGFVDLVMHPAAGGGSGIESIGDQSDDLRGIDLVLGKFRECGGGAHRLGAAVWDGVERAHPLGHLIGEFTGGVSDLVQDEVSVTEVDANDVPVRLLGLNVELDEVNEHGLQIVGELLICFHIEDGTRGSRGFNPPFIAIRWGDASARPVPRRVSIGSARKPRLSRDVLVLGVIAFFVMVGFGVVVPVLPVYVRSFGVGNAEVGAVVSAFALLRFVSSPFCGRLIDWAGERAILSIGIGIVALSSGLVGVAQNYPQLLILRGIGGIGSAMFTVSAMTLLIGSTSVAMRARSIGFYQGGFLIGGMTGPALGGLLATISLSAPFFFYAGTLAVAGVVGILLLRPRTVAPPTESGTTVSIPLREVLRDRGFRAACLANFAQGWTSFGVRNSLVPVLIVEVLRGPSTWTGIAFAFSAVAQTVALAPAARFIDTVGRKPAIVGSFAVAAATIAAVPFVTSFWALTALLCLYGVAAAFMGTAPAAAVGDAVGAQGGRPVALFSMFSDFGAIIGPLVAGFLADTVSYPVAFAVGAAFFVGASAYALRMPGRSRPPVAG